MMAKEINISFFFISRFLLYHVPGFILLNFKRPKVDIDLHLKFAFEILRYSPRVPAEATSPVLELSRNQHLPGLAKNLECRCRQPLPPFHYGKAISFPGAPFELQAN